VVAKNVVVAVSEEAVAVPDLVVQAVALVDSAARQVVAQVDSAARQVVAQVDSAARQVVVQVDLVVLLAAGLDPVAQAVVRVVSVALQVAVQVDSEVLLAAVLVPVAQAVARVVSVALLAAGRDPVDQAVDFVALPVQVEQVVDSQAHPAQARPVPPARRAAVFRALQELVPREVLPVAHQAELPLELLHRPAVEAARGSARWTTRLPNRGRPHQAEQRPVAQHPILVFKVTQPALQLARLAQHPQARATVKMPRPRRFMITHKWQCMPAMKTMHSTCSTCELWSTTMALQILWTRCVGSPR